MRKTSRYALNPRSLAIGLLIGLVVMVAGVWAGEATPAGVDEPGLLQKLFENGVIATFAVIGGGLLLGKVSIKGLSLGSSGVLFIALLAGHFGVTVSSAVGRLGLVLFVYCIGVAAGPSFFRAFVRQGKQLAMLAIVVVGSGALCAVAFAKLAHVPADLAVGILAGSLTSTPALATAVEVLGDGSDVSIGYGVAYPFGVVGVVLFVQLLPRLLGRDIDKEAQELGKGATKRREIVRALVEVTNQSLVGKPMEELAFLHTNYCWATRVLRGDRLVPLDADYVIEPGAVLWLVGAEEAVNAAVDYFGKRSQRDFVVDTERERRNVVVTSASMVGSTIAEIRPLRQHGVVISRITRQDIPFVPTDAEVLRPGDVLTCVGDEVKLEAFAQAAGHRAKAVDETDMISLAIGVTLGVIVGMAQIGLPGGNTLSLGMAGGPLLVALVLGHFGRIGGVVGYLPRASRMLMTELGLVFFLAWAGTQAGGSFVEVIQEHGVILLAMGVATTLVPMVLGFVFATYAMKMPLVRVLGGMCGGMTSTPGLGAITAKTDADAPVISYAAAYPVALILMTVAAKIVIAMI